MTLALTIPAAKSPGKSMMETTFPAEKTGQKHDGVSFPRPLA